MKWCSYDESGKILNTGTAPSSSTIADFAHMSEQILMNIQDDVSWESHYVLAGAITQRQTMPITVSGMKLSGATATAEIEIEGVVYECDGSDIELEFTHPGVYLVKVVDWPLLDWSAEIENQA